MTPPILETPRLLLRGHRLTDFEDMAALWADDAVVRFIQGVPQSREAVWARLLRYVGHWGLMGFGYWVVTAKEDGRYLGEIGLGEYQRDMTPPLGDRPDAGWMIRPAEHGKGIATEAVARMLAWADAELAYEETVCIIKPPHLASQNVAKKVGYRPERESLYHDAPTLVLARRRTTSASP